MDQNGYGWMNVEVGITEKTPGPVARFKIFNLEQYLYINFDCYYDDDLI